MCAVNVVCARCESSYVPSSSSNSCPLRPPAGRHVYTFASLTYISFIATDQLHGRVNMSSTAFDTPVRLPRVVITFCTQCEPIASTVLLELDQSPKFDPD